MRSKCSTSIIKLFSKLEKFLSLICKFSPKRSTTVVPSWCDSHNFSLSFYSSTAASLDCVSTEAARKTSYTKLPFSIQCLLPHTASTVYFNLSYALRFKHYFSSFRSNSTSLPCYSTIIRHLYNLVFPQKPLYSIIFPLFCLFFPFSNAISSFSTSLRLKKETASLYRTIILSAMHDAYAFYHSSM